MVELNKIGYIVEGYMKDFFVKVISDRENTGGYYIIYSKNFNKKDSEGYDEFYFGLDTVESRLADSSINWIE